MAEKIISPGVFTNEIDQSFLPAAVQAIGAAVVGPTQKGPALVPTRVSSYSEFLTKFGGDFSSGSGAAEDAYKYLTNYSVQEYLKYADTLTVVRVLAGDFGPASTQVSSSGGSAATPGVASTGSFQIFGVDGVNYQQFTNDTVQLIAEGNESLAFLFTSGSSGGTDIPGVDLFRYTGGISGLATEINTFANSYFSASVSGNNLILSSSRIGAAGNDSRVSTGSLGQFIFGSGITGSSGHLGGGSGATPAGTANAFRIFTLADGEDQNSACAEGTNGLLTSGSANNLRWEVTNVNNAKGTFTLLIRRGDDTNRRKTILEQYNNLTLDPTTPNYIARAIGDQKFTMRDSGTNDPFLQLSGSFPNRSRYVRVEVTNTTYKYLDENGDVRDGSLSGSLPIASSGSFSGGSDGNVKHPRAFYDEISNTNTQGFNLGVATEGKTAYTDAIRLLKNQDEYDINLITLPGLVDNFTNHAEIITEALNMCEDRSDCFLVYDPVEYASALSTATAKAESRDSNYAAVYWPWVKIPDADLGKNVWVPASTLIPSVYAFNDRVAAPWFAPAGLNRGGIDVAVMTERKLTKANRDDLYDASVNPIATFPNTGVTVFGQKTLQKKASALDRVNVRRLLIAAKKFIASTTKFLVFEQNTAATRNRFLGIANPYFEDVQQRQGLFAFRVVMDETNNTPDVIDRNEMRGQIFLQPAKTAEFIIIDFNILPTGAEFPE
jgi:hypothetical protein